MKKIIVLLFLLINLSAGAQIYYRRSEFGFGLGGSNYFGDLNQDLIFQTSRYSGSIFYKYNFTPYIAIKFGANYAKLHGDDQYSPNTYQKTRNLSFFSDLGEAAMMFDFHFFKYRVQDYYHRFTPYVTLGVGMFWHNPYAIFDGKRYDLRPLGTEGQLYAQYADRRYKRHAFSFPIGMGFKCWLRGGTTLFVEVINRSTTTDYIDDVSTTYVGVDKFVDNTPSPYPSASAALQDRSVEGGYERIGIAGKQRGISSTKDQFMTAQIGLSFRLPTYKCPSSFETAE